MPKLTVQNAEIKTATVEVRTLTLSGKQVTLSVFKQIEQAELITDRGELAGEPWGRVNYHPDKCADERHHLHVVWQHGSELRRSNVPAPRIRNFGTNELDQFLTAAAFDYFQGGREHFSENLPTKPRAGMSAAIGGTFNLHGLTVSVEADRAADSAAQAIREVTISDTNQGRTRGRNWEGNETSSRHDAALRRREEAMAALGRIVDGYGRPLTELAAVAKTQVTEELSRRERDSEAWALLNTLPQLFIAV